MMANNTKVITGVVKLLYPNLFSAKSINGGVERYSSVILIPKNDIATLEAIHKAINMAEENGCKKFGEFFRNGQLKKPLRDGDRETNNSACNGYYFLNAKNTNQPQIVDKKLVPINDSREIYSGVYAKVSLYFYPYNQRGNRGIACGLGNVQKVKEGEPYSLLCSAASEFSIIEDDFLQ